MTELDRLVSELQQATHRLETAPVGDFTRLAALFARRAELIGALSDLIPRLDAGQFSAAPLDALRADFAQGVLLAGRLSLKRLELGGEFEALMRQKTLTRSFARPPAGPPSRVIDCQG